MSDELVNEIALSIDAFIALRIERDTLASELTQGELTELSLGILEIIYRHREQAAAEERAKIVAWLYDEQREYPRTEYSGFAAMIAEMISAKEHLK